VKGSNPPWVIGGLVHGTVSSAGLGEGNAPGWFLRGTRARSVTNQGTGSSGRFQPREADRRGPSRYVLHQLGPQITRVAFSITWSPVAHTQRANLHRDTHAWAEARTARCAQGEGGENSLKATQRAAPTTSPRRKEKPLHTRSTLMVTPHPHSCSHSYPHLALKATQRAAPTTSPRRKEKPLHTRSTLMGTPPALVSADNRTRTQKRKLAPTR
jgi:hypothetical protein